jgi:hypothetical protein
MKYEGANFCYSKSLKKVIAEVKEQLGLPESERFTLEVLLISEVSNVESGEPDEKRQRLI